MGSRLGVKLSLAGVAVRNAGKARAARVAKRLITTDWESLVRDPKIDVVMELMGGTTTARKVVAEALKLGKPVITANKALISAHGESIFRQVEKDGGNLYYEAAVAGGIPIIKSLREGLSGNRIQRLYGILNGTCNFILTQMEAEGRDFEDILADAQRKGYAEAEPSLDVDGFDAQHKAGILASLAHGFWIKPSQILLRASDTSRRSTLSLRDAWATASSCLASSRKWVTTCKLPSTRHWCRRNMCWPTLAACTMPSSFAATLSGTRCTTGRAPERMPRRAQC